MNATASIATPTNFESKARLSVTGPAPSAATNHLTKKVQKTLTVRVDSQASRDALKCLSGFFDENSLQSRRNLRTTTEGQNLLLHQEFVNSFAKIEEKINDLENFVNVLDVSCERATNQLRQSKSDTQAVLEKAASLKNEARAIDEKQEVLSHFLARFQLSEKDTQLVRSGDTPLDDEFFSAFEHLEQVRKNARHLLNTCGQQTSGVDILHETSEILEAAYERLFVWVQQQCRSSKSSAVTKISSAELDGPGVATLKRVLSLLVERPVYFNHCIRDLARARRQVLVQRFFEALNSGDSTSGSRPMDLGVCDPVRYVSDMLAWIHENAASERIALAALMGKASEQANETVEKPVVRTNSESLMVLSLDEIVDFTLEGLAQNFNNRVKQVLETQTSIVITYKVAQIFAFYAKTLVELLGREDSSLVMMCRDNHLRTHQAFLDIWERQSQKLRQGVSGVYVSDVRVPSFVTEAVNTLSEILSIYEMALVPAKEREADFLPVLSAAFDPLVNHCQQVAAMMDASDGHVFLINCIAAMQHSLKTHDFTAQRVAMYSALLEDHVRLLVEGQSISVLSKVGLAERLQALREKPTDVPISNVPELHPVSLASTLRSFYNSLFTLGGALALPALERIANRTIRAEARSGVARSLGNAYEELYEGIKELDVATHTPDQVRTLLQE